MIVGCGEKKSSGEVVQENRYSNFIPKGYELLDTATGDLNRDDVEDALLLLNKTNEESNSNYPDQPSKRLLMILLADSNGNLQVKSKSENAVYCVDCGGIMGDPYQQLVIKNGYFSIEHYGGSAWRWSRIITFKYNSTEDNWYLHRDGGVTFHASNPDSTTTHMRTIKDFGLVSFESFDCYAED